MSEEPPQEHSRFHQLLSKGLIRKVGDYGNYKELALHEAPVMRKRKKEIIKRPKFHKTDDNDDDDAYQRMPEAPPEGPPPDAPPAEVPPPDKPADEEAPPV